MDVVLCMRIESHTLANMVRMMMMNCLMRRVKEEQGEKK